MWKLASRLCILHTRLGVTMLSAYLARMVLNATNYWRTRDQLLSFQHTAVNDSALWTVVDQLFVLQWRQSHRVRGHGGGRHIQRRITTVSCDTIHRCKHPLLQRPLHSLSSIVINVPSAKPINDESPTHQLIYSRIQRHTVAMVRWLTIETLNISSVNMIEWLLYSTSAQVTI